MTVARQITDARIGGSLRVAKLRGHAGHRDTAAASRLSREGPHELPLAVAVDPREADNLALPDLNRYVGKASATQLRHVENDACAAIVALGREVAIERTANDQFDDFLFAEARGLIRALALTVAKNRQAMRNSLDFADPVRDIDHRTTRSRYLADALEQTLDVFRQQVFGRFVEDQNLGLCSQRFDDFNDEALLRAQAHHALV